MITSDYSSKIRHILGLAGFEDYRESCLPRNYKYPSPSVIIDKLDHFDKNKARRFAENYYSLYMTNMVNIIDSFGNEIK